MKPISPHTAILATLLPNHCLLIRPDAWPDFAGPLNRLPKLGRVKLRSSSDYIRLNACPKVAVFTLPDATDPSARPWRVIWNLGEALDLAPIESDFPSTLDAAGRSFLREYLKADSNLLRRRLNRAMLDVSYDVRQPYPEIQPGVWLVQRGKQEPSDNPQIHSLLALSVPAGHAAHLVEPTPRAVLTALDKLRMGEGLRVEAPPLSDLPKSTEDFVYILSESNGKTYADYWRVTPRPHKGWSPAFEELFDTMEPGDSFLLPKALAERLLANARQTWRRYRPDDAPLVTRKDPASGGVFVWCQPGEGQEAPAKQNHVEPKPGAYVEIDGHTLQVVSGRPLPVSSGKEERFKSTTPAEGFPSLAPGEYLEIGAGTEARSLAHIWRQRMTRAKLSVRVAATPSDVWFIKRLAPAHAEQPSPVKADPNQTLMTGGGTVAEALARHLAPATEIETQTNQQAQLDPA